MKTFTGWIISETATKVVNAGGQPLVVWHGSKSDFDKFDKNYIGQTDDGYYGRGFYFSPNEEDASGYGKAKPYHLWIKNPFVLPSHADLGHESLYDLRDKLAALKGVKVARSNRQLPKGYTVQEDEKDNRYYNPNSPPSKNNPKIWKIYSVYPQPELYGTEGEVYGPEAPTPQQAIIKFNDERAETQMNGGWAFGLLKELIDRNKFVDILQTNGYDGIFVQNPESGEVKEYVAFEPEQITPARG